jgi:hypothetical protein
LATPLIVRDTATGLSWQRESAGVRTYGEASLYCQGLRLGLSGYRWRLPEVDELATLVDVRAFSGPAVDTDVFPDATTSFWSATPFAPSATTHAWSLDFASGIANGSTVDARFRVRCVRN